MGRVNTERIIRFLRNQEPNPWDEEEIAQSILDAIADSDGHIWVDFFKETLARVCDVIEAIEWESNRELEAMVFDYKNLASEEDQANLFNLI